MYKRFKNPLCLLCNGIQDEHQKCKLMIEQICVSSELLPPLHRRGGGRKSPSGFLSLSLLLSLLKYHFTKLWKDPLRLESLYTIGVS